MKKSFKILMTLSVILAVTSCNILNDVGSGNEEDQPGNVTFARISASENSITVTWTDPEDEDLDHIKVVCSNGDNIDIAPGVQTKTFSVSKNTEYKISLISSYSDGTTSDKNHLVYVTTPVTGTIEYKPVYTAAELINATSMDGGLQDNYILIDDLDLSALSIKYWNPIGDYSNNNNEFMGIFDGNYHKISGLYISSSSLNGVGFFASTDNAIIRNVNIVNANIKGSSSTGALIGNAVDTTISNCYSTGNISAQNHVGGLVGYMFSRNQDITISHCYSTGNVSGSDNTGGLVGYITGNAKITISNCYSTGNVSGSDNTGGLVGYISNITITISNCYSTGNVSGSDNTGGLVGYNHLLDIAVNTTTISNCYSTGNVSGSDNTGGLVGYLFLDDSQNHAAISNCYSTGPVTGTGNNIGGAIGFCTYNTVYFGGIANLADVVDLSNLYWNKTLNSSLDDIANDYTGHSVDVATITSLTTTKMKDLSNYTGFDASVWDIDGTTNDGYPFLKDMP